MSSVWRLHSSKATQNRSTYVNFLTFFIWASTGFYTPTQCDGCVGECWCSFIDGKEISGTRGPARTVRC
ncbi:hypothetical protein BaRGS_00022425 [Batillaria attramentaria]|uniref:Thyroglobulin type-1 domain-containing protein n=1 Tax=Batillaria attramentaria TaxID=370345 RepID=A0ABD0KH73_9CAEN